MCLFGVGAVGAASYLFFFRALAIGPISIVSPMVFAYAAVTVLLAVVVLGERLSGRGPAAAFAVAMVGVVLASTDPRRMSATRRVATLGVVLAVLAMVWLGGASCSASATTPTTSAGWRRSSWRARSAAC